MTTEKRTSTTNLVLQGIGGQGTLTMMEILALAAERADEEVRVLSRVSLARLGGSGSCHLRLGPSLSPAIPIGEADILLCLEMSEVLRILPLARRGALAFVNTYRRLPIAAGTRGLRYPAQEEIAEALRMRGVEGIFVAPGLLGGEASAEQLNVSMLGVCCGYTRLLAREVLEEAIGFRLPRFAEANLRTFEAGWTEGVKLASQRRTFRTQRVYEKVVGNQAIKEGRSFQKSW